MAWIASSLRRLRSERVATAGLALLVLVTGFVFAVAPRALERTADVALQAEVGTATPLERHVQMIEESRIPASATGASGPLAAAVERGATLGERLPSSLRAIIVENSIQVDSGRYEVEQPGDPAFLRLRIQPGADRRLRWLEGRPPTGATRMVDDVGPQDVDDVLVLEAAVADETADVFGVAVGDTVQLVGDPSDPLIGPRGGELRLAVDLVGVYEVTQPDAEWWLADPMLARPVVRALGAGSETRFVDAAALLVPEAYPALVAANEQEQPPLRYTWRSFVDPGRLAARSVGGLTADLRRLQTAFPSVTPTAVYETGLRTGLLPLVERQQARWASAAAILTVVALGPAAVALAALALVALLAASRRRVALSVSRARGASLGQLVAAAVAEGLLLSVPAVGLAVLVAVVLVPGRADPATLIAAVAVAVGTVVILVATSVPSAAASAGRAPAAPMVRPVTPRRLVMEALLVALALGGAWLLRERGVRGASSAAALATADPLIAAVPALAGMAAGLLAVRLLPVPMRLLASLASRRRGLVPVLALRRATGGAGAAPVLIVLLATATIGAFSSAALVHLERAAETVAWQEVGAAYRIASPAGALPGTLRPEELPGAEAATTVFRQTVPVGTTGPRLELVVLDVATYRDVVRGTPADPGLPAELLGPAASPIPALVSSSLGARPDGVAPGETFQLSVEGFTLSYRAAVVRDTFPGVAPNTHFAIVSRAHFLAAAPPARIAPGAALVRAPAQAADAIRSTALAVVAGGRVESRAERTSALRESPVSDAVRGGIIAAVVIAGVYAALAVAAALALAGLSRAIEVAHLRTLGLTRGEAFGLVAVEHAPTIVTALVLGVALGLGLFLLLRPGLGLSALVGSAIDVPLTVDPGQLALVLAAGVAVVGLGLLIGAVLQRAAVPAAAIRRGFE